MTYVEDACDDCGLRLPRKDFRLWTEQEAIAREDDTYQRFASGRTGYKQGKTTYRIKHLRLCPGCYSKRHEAAEAAEAARRAAEAAAGGRRLLTAALIVGALIVTAVMCSTVLRTPTLNSDAPVNELAGDNQAGGNAVPLTNSDAVTDTNAAEMSAANDAQATGQLLPTNEVAAASSPSPDSAQSAGGSPLSIAIDEALQTGRPVRWTDGPDSGVVSVGDRRLWRGRPCRTYGFTTNGVRSPVVISCRGTDGTWHPADTYTNAAAPAQE